MDKLITLEDARVAKHQASDTLAFRQGVVGIGLTFLGEGYAIKVNVETSIDIASIPTHFVGVPVVVDVVGTIAALPELRAIG